LKFIFNSKCIKGMFLIENRLGFEQASLPPLCRHGVLFGKEKTGQNRQIFTTKKGAEAPFPEFRLN